MASGILVIGGDFRRALPELDALAAAYARTAGPTAEDALERFPAGSPLPAELVQATAALRQFRQVLAHVRAASGNASPTALELRRNIGMLLLSEGKAEEAADEQQPLHDDHLWSTAPHHPPATHRPRCSASKRPCFQPGAPLQRDS